MRFRILADFELCTTDNNQQWNSNFQELNNCSKSVLSMYNRCRIFLANNRSETVSPAFFKNEAEMISYNILAQIAPIAVHRPESAIQKYFVVINSLLLSIPENVRKTKEVLLAVEIYYCFITGNYNRFFLLYRSEETPFLITCLMHSFVFCVRVMVRREKEERKEGNNFYLVRRFVE